MWTFSVFLYYRKVADPEICDNGEDDDNDGLIDCDDPDCDGAQNCGTGGSCEAPTSSSVSVANKVFVFPNEIRLSLLTPQKSQLSPLQVHLLDNVPPNKFYYKLLTPQ